MKTKLEQIQQQYPDAVEYYKKSQAYVKEDIARIEAYGKDIPAKSIFYRDIPSTTGVTQQYIFSEQAAKDELSQPTTSQQSYKNEIENLN